MNNTFPTHLDQAVLNWLHQFGGQGMLITDRDLHIVGWNHWLESHSNLATTEVLGRPLFEVFPSLVERRLDRWFQQALVGQSAMLAQRLHRYILPLPTAVEGTSFSQMQQSVRIAPLTINNEVVGTIMLIEDVTERVAREHELKQQIIELQTLQAMLQSSEAAQRLLAEASSLLASSLEYRQTLVNLAQFAVPTLADWCAISVLNEHGTLELAAATHRSPDQAALVQQIAQHPSQTLPPAPFVQVLHEGRSLLRSEIDQASLAELVAEPEYARLLHELEVRSWISVPLRLRDQVLGVLTLGMSRSGRRFANSDLQLSEELAHRASLALDNADLYRIAQAAIRDREDFISIASHELRTPLTALMGQAMLLQRRTEREGSLSERHAQSLITIIAQAQRLNRMIDSLLDVSKIQTGQLTLNIQPLDLPIMLQRVASDIFATLTTHQLQTSGLDQPISMLGDEVRLGQVFSNLLQNAVKYSPDGGTIELTVQIVGEQAVISVRDPGLGIPAAALPNLFKRFYRVPGEVVQRTNGLGLGLFVVKEIVAHHGGTIQVESVEHVSSTFTVYLPLNGPERTA